VSGFVFKKYDADASLPQTRTVALPSDSTFAVAMKTQQAAEREEQQRIKNLVLNYDLREGDDLDGDSPFAPSSPRNNIDSYNVGAEKTAGANYARPDKSSNNRSGQRARKLQLSDVDWYDHPKGSLNPSPITRPGKVSSFKHTRGPNAALRQRPDQAVNSGLGFSVTQPRQPPQSSKALPKINGKGRLTRREILQEHASRIAAKADAEK
jgi:regulator of nonsense transcripts 2